MIMETHHPRTRRTAFTLIALAFLMVGSLVTAPRANATDTAVSLGALCYDGGFQSTVNVVAAPNQAVATQMYLQKWNGIAKVWETKVVTDWDVFKLTFSDGINPALGNGSQAYSFSINASGYWRAWAHVYFWDPVARQWYGETWKKPEVYSYLVNGSLSTSPGKWCLYG